MPVQFKTAFNNLAPETIYEPDPTTRTLRPYSSAEAYQGAGFKFGDQQQGDPSAFAGFTVGAPIRSRAEELAAVKEDLNTTQNQVFSEQSAPAKRKSSSIQDQIESESAANSAAREEFDSLRKRLTELTAPSYADEYAKLRQSQGVPAIEGQFLDVRQTRRELPFTERANTGNAGIATESQLNAQTRQKDIPLEAREANLIDRLKLASDFVANSLKFKEMDVNTSRQALSDAINLVGETINISRGSLNDLRAAKDKEQARQDGALKFRLENNISTPFFNVGGTIYDSGSLEGIPSEEAFQERYSMTLQDAVAKGLLTTISGETANDKALALDLASKYPDAGILSSDTFAKASAKLKNSRIYQEQVRAPVGAGGGGGGVQPGDDPQLYAGLSTPTATAVRAQVNGFKTEPTVQNFATVQDGYNFASSISNTTKNPADDQALIYSLAKALDPGSVVREGEYATAQKYAQSWVNAYGKQITQAIAGTGFLSEVARKNIKATIAQKYKSTKVSYDNISAQYASTIGKLTGRDDGASFIKSYVANTPQDSVKPDDNQSQETTSPETKGFWSKVGNWLFGSD